MLFLTLTLLAVSATVVLVIFGMVHLLQVEGAKRYGVLLLYVLLLLSLAAIATYILYPLHPMKDAPLPAHERDGSTMALSRS